VQDFPDEVGIDQFKHYFSPELIRGLKRFKFCGNYGDPIAAKDIISFHQYLWEHNPDLAITVSTNGGLKSLEFWEELGALYRDHQQSYIEFHIDGLEDTNHLYRINVRWSKLIDNVKAFNGAGGNSQWVFIPFFHNEHQVEKAEQMSVEVGCKQFVVKPTTRFGQAIIFTHKNGSLRPATSPEFRKPVKHGGRIDCLAERRKEIYVDAWGRLWPCCWTASAFHSKSPIQNDLETRSITEILQDPDVNVWIQKMYGDVSSVCKRCSNSDV
jgi:hypothetical protein